jgi:hypothetical protein
MLISTSIRAKDWGNLSNDPRDLLVLDDVNLPGPGPVTERARDRFDMRRLVDERESRSPLAKQFGDRLPDPAGRSCYEDDSAREVEDARKLKRAIVCQILARHFTHPQCCSFDCRLRRWRCRADKRIGI